MRYLLLLALLSGCATESIPTLETFMRTSYYQGCLNEAEALAMSQVETEAAYYRCDAKSKSWNIYESVPQYNDNLDIILRRQKNLDLGRDIHPKAN